MLGSFGKKERKYSLQKNGCTFSAVSHVTVLYLFIVKTAGQNGKQLPISHLYHQSKTYLVISD